MEQKQKELDLRGREMNKDSVTYTNNDVASTTPIGNLTTEEMVVEIRNEFTRINSLRSTAKRYKFECDAEGIADYYWENNQLVKIAIDWGFLGDYSNKSEYYHKDGKLIFSYELSLGGPAGGNVKTTE